MANWVIACTGIYLKMLYGYCHRLLVQRNFAMADETPVQVLKEEGREAAAKSICGCSGAAQTERRRSSCIIMHRPGVEIPQVSFSRASTGTLWWMGTLGITKRRISDAAVLLISGDISSMRSPKGNSVIPAFLQCRVSNTATSCLRMSGTLKKTAIRIGRSKTDVSSMKNR